MRFPAVYISKTIGDSGNNVDPSESVTIENCTVNLTADAESNTNGLYLLQTNNVTVKGCTINNAPYHGIFVRALQNAEIADNTVTNAKHDGIKVETQVAGYTNTPKSVVVTGNSVKAVENGIRVKSLTEFPAVCTVTGNTVDMSIAKAFSNGEPWGILLVSNSSTVNPLLNVSGNIKVGTNEHWFDYEGFTPAADSNYSNPF